MNDMLRYFFSLATIAKIQATLITLALSFGLYLEHFEELAPCSLCMLQRYLFLSAILFAISIAYLEKLKYFFVTLNLISLFLGTLISAKQVRLQYRPRKFFFFKNSQNFIRLKPQLQRNTLVMARHINSRLGFSYIYIFNYFKYLCYISTQSVNL